MSSVPTGGLPLQIGPYRPLRRLGQGGMGVVYGAQDTRDLSRIVALKVISAAGQTDTKADDTARRFVREAKILESLRHQNIVTFFEIGLEGRQNYLAMEMLTGTTLSPWVGRPWTDSLPLMIQVCEGMKYLAGRKIVHRDLSLENVFVVNDAGRLVAKILDFGIAKDTTAEETIHDFTKTGLLMGKPQYWSPEQIGDLEPGDKIDWRSDIYTLGVIFYRLLAGRLPFEADSPAAYITLHLMQAAPPLEPPEGRPEIPAAITDMVLRMMEKRREERPQSYDDILHAFRSELVVRGIDETNVTAPFPLPEQTGFTSPLSRAPLPAGTPTSATSPRAITALPKTAEYKDGAYDPTAAMPVAVPREPTARPAPAPPPAKRFPAGAAAAGVGVLALATAAWLLLKPKAPTGEPVPDTPTTAATAPETPAAAASETGTLRLTSLPWARIVSVTDVATGKAVPLPGGELVTPRDLPLPPGRYAIELASGLGAETKRVTVDVKLGAVVAENVTLVPPEKAVELLQ